MLQAAIKTVNLSLNKYSFIFNRNRNYWVLFVGIFFCSLNNNSALAQNKNITVDQNNKNQPIAIRGISGGAIAALEITQTKKTATGYCDGFVSPQANHLLKLDTFFNNLRLEVKSSADTTILVKGAGGIWCNDDAGSANPMIEGQWQPGTYRIWVGSYQPDSKNNYQINIIAK